jgi:transposase
LTAGKILARVGDISRFRSAAAFASYTGTAPIEVSSGDVVRHRLSRAGDRQLNAALHTMALSQIRSQGTGRDYYQRKRAEGKGHKEAIRCLIGELSGLRLEDRVVAPSVVPGDGLVAVPRRWPV